MFALESGALKNGHLSIVQHLVIVDSKLTEEHAQHSGVCPVLP